YRVEHAVLADDVPMPARLAYFVPVVLSSREDGVLLAEPRPTNTSGDFITLAGTDGFVELPRGPAAYARGTPVRLFRWERERSEPGRHVGLHDGRIERVQRLLARRTPEPHVAESRVLEPDTVIGDVERAPL